MSYTDAPDAQVQMNAFLERCAAHDILCSSFHLSSGYTSIGSRRYVFNWNRDKFPDPAGFVSHYSAHGVRLVPNIKPCLLRDHPQFDACARDGLFIRDADGSPHLVQFWGELGALLDFTNPKTVTWWQAQVTSSLLDVGMAATWNDNNEFEVRDPQALADFGGNPGPAIATKPLQTMLMVQASRDAQRAHRPGLRPFVVTRAGFAGMQRYAQSWSGDNMTGWETLRYNLRMGLGLALSGLSNTGHDVGGFAGPAPDEELFVRWVECGIFMPRFSIHSWNDDGTVNEPWMHAAATPMVRDLLKQRARLAPYLYDLMWRAHRDYAPVIRSLFHDFPDDPASYDEHDEMLLGRALLVAPVMTPGLQGRQVYLPRGTHWIDVRTGEWHEGGQSVFVEAPLGQPPLLARAGTAVPVNMAALHFNREPDERGFLVFAAPDGGDFEARCFEDDGESDACLSGRFGEWVLRVSASAREIPVHVSLEGDVVSRPARLTLVFPAGEARRVSLSGAGRKIASSTLQDGSTAITLSVS
jgi:alpha-glucosidase